MGKTSIEWTDHSINPIRARLDGKVGHYCERDLLTIAVYVATALVLAVYAWVRNR
jgi:hypothetical protein